MRLTIGVTGHRDVVVTEGLKQSIREYIEKLILKNSQKEITLLSPLADGADRLVADSFLELQSTYNNLKFIVPMPFDKERYMEDFDEKSKRDFFNYLQRADNFFEVEDTQNDGYRSVGVFVANRADVLLALWDGTDNHKAGGTADIVKYSKSQGHIVKHFLCKREESYQN